MSRIFFAATAALVALSACATPQPMGENLWKAVRHVQQDK